MSTVAGIRTYSPDEDLVRAKRAEIVRQACKVFIVKGYDGTSMRDLAKAMGKSTGAFYHYIGSKRDILHLILDFTVTNQQDFLARMHSEVNGLNPTQALRECIRIYIESLEEFADLHVFVNHVMVSLGKAERNTMLEAANRVSDFFEELLERGVAVGEFTDVNPKIVAHNIVVTGNSWVNRRWFWRKHFTLEKYVQGQTDLVLRMISCNADSIKEAL